MYRFFFHYVTKSGLYTHISGETSAGKSTLINKLFEKQLFRGRNNESTSTICKLRNSERIRVITTDMRGQREETDFTDKCNLETKEGVKMLRNFLKDLTDLTSSEKSATFNSVEVEFPIPFLRVNYAFLTYTRTHRMFYFFLLK